MFPRDGLQNLTKII